MPSYNHWLNHLVHLPTEALADGEILTKLCQILRIKERFHEEKMDKVMERLARRSIGGIKKPPLNQRCFPPMTFVKPLIQLARRVLLDSQNLIEACRLLNVLEHSRQQATIFGQPIQNHLLRLRAVRSTHPIISFR
jgi:hypothetical protein